MAVRGWLCSRGAAQNPPVPGTGLQPRGLHPRARRRLLLAQAVGSGVGFFLPSAWSLDIRRSYRQGNPSDALPAEMAPALRAPPSDRGVCNRVIGSAAVQACSPGGRLSASAGAQQQKRAGFEVASAGKQQKTGSERHVSRSTKQAAPDISLMKVQTATQSQGSFHESFSETSSNYTFKENQRDWQYRFQYDIPNDLYDSPVNASRIE